MSFVPWRPPDTSPAGSCTAAIDAIKRSTAVALRFEPSTPGLRVHALRGRQRQRRACRRHPARCRSAGRRAPPAGRQLCGRAVRSAARIAGRGRRHRRRPRRRAHRLGAHPDDESQRHRDLRHVVPAGASRAVRRARARRDRTHPHPQVPTPEPERGSAVDRSPHRRPFSAAGARQRHAPRCGRAAPWCSSISAPAARWSKRPVR